MYVQDAEKGKRKKRFIEDGKVYIGQRGSLQVINVETRYRFPVENFNL